MSIWEWIKSLFRGSDEDDPPEVDLDLEEDDPKYDPSQDKDKVHDQK